MLEEIIASFLSLFSALTLDAPRLSSEMNDNTSLSEHSTRCTWEDRIHREYISFEEETKTTTRLLTEQQFVSNWIHTELVGWSHLALVIVQGATATASRHY